MRYISVVKLTFKTLSACVFYIPLPKETNYKISNGIQACSDNTPTMPCSGQDIPFRWL